MSEGGWNAFLTSWAAADLLNPVSAAFLAANCDAAAQGWPCDPEMEKLRDAFARESEPARQKQIAERVQQRAIEIGTHVWVGQWYKPMAYRKDRLEGFIEAPVPAILASQQTRELTSRRKNAVLTLIAYRLLSALPVLAIFAILVFLMAANPRDPAAVIAGDTATEQQIAEIRSRLGLDRPIAEQFLSWARRGMRGDFGDSFFFKKPVSELIGQRLEPTVSLALLTILLSVVIAAPWGSSPPIARELSSTAA